MAVARPTPGLAAGPRRRVSWMSLSGRDGARLEHEQLTVLERPLDVLRAAEALLEVDTDLRQADELRLVEGLRPAPLGWPSG